MATIEQRVYEGNRAKEVLENEVFVQVFADIEQELYEAWTQSPARDTEGRERIHQYQMMLRKVKSNLQTTFDTGRLARLDIDNSSSSFDRIKDYLSDMLP